MSTTKLITPVLVLVSYLAVAGRSSADSVSFSGTVSCDDNQAVSQLIFGDAQLYYTFLSDTVSLSQFDLGILNSVELTVDCDIEVETDYYYYWNAPYYTSQWWYFHVIGSANGLQAMCSGSHHTTTTGQGDHNHVFTINGMASETASSGLAGFIGAGQVDVAIAGDDNLCAWWNPYEHHETDTYGTVTVTLTYEYSPMTMDIKPETLDLKSKGLFTAFIELPEGYSEEDVDISTVRCQGAPAVDATMGDDGKLIVKFGRQQLVGVSVGDAVKLTVTGSLADGTPFAVSDAIRITDR